MSLSIGYESVEEALMRLNNTVVMYDGVPVIVTNVASARPGDPKPDIFRVYASPLPYNGVDYDEDDKLRKFISSRKFDMATVKLGFVNIGGDAVYCSRAPKKQYKQGLSAETLEVKSASGRAPAFNFRVLITRKEFVDCIMGRYPSFKDALAAGVPTAFCRDFAVVPDAALDGLVYLNYKLDRVGYFNDDGRVVLGKNFKFLRELLLERGMKIA